MTVTINLAPALEQINLLLQRLDDLVPFYDAVGEFAVHQIQERLREGKTTPSGMPWAPWRPFTEEQRFLKGNTSQGLLWDTGALIESIRFDVDGNFDVTIGTDLDYGKTLQDGIPGKMEPRPFIGWETNDFALMEQAAIRYFTTGSPGRII